MTSLDTHRTESDPTTDLPPTDSFLARHLGSGPADIAAMLQALDLASLDDLTDQAIPESIRLNKPLNLPKPLSEHDALVELQALAEHNQVFRSFIGMGYHGTITPAVIRRNILENPGWYTQYTPYQAEIAQGRLEALLNFQTMIADLTGLPAANASLLDEATAAAEAMGMCYAIGRSKRGTFIVDPACHPQTIAVVKTRGESMGVKIVVTDPAEAVSGDAADDICGVLLQYPTTDGRVIDYSDLIEQIHETKALAVVAADPLALTVLKAPGEMEADIAVGSTQRFGVPMGYGGPHAAYMACHEKHVRKMPGRLVGVSRDAAGNPALRLAIQTREQHIKRDKATSNICTAQVLLAIIAAMYATWHGADGLRRIARRVAALTDRCARGLVKRGYELGDSPRFDTITVDLGDEAQRVLDVAWQRRMNFRDFGDGRVGISFDETHDELDVEDVLACFVGPDGVSGDDYQPAELPQRDSPILTHPVFSQYHQEHEMLRYIKRLEQRDLSLTTSMIPLGSCTMKLNAAAEMLPITWPQLADLHPYCPADQVLGYRTLIGQLSDWLAEITGLPGVSMQPNAGSQGEYAGLLTIRAYHHGRGDTQRDVCLIPTSAHGTNPASAVIAGLRVVPVDCDERGNIDIDDLKAKAEKHADQLSSLMITYPSTHGVFEAGIQQICQIVHDHGGQVYMDGANMNAQIGLTRPAECGADVVHLNLHKTFCIPHGGGGPGMGPICCAEHLKPYLPDDPGQQGERAVSAAPFGSPMILPISWMFIRMIGGEGLKTCGQVAILNANYMAARIREHLPILYTGHNDRSAHEFILDCRGLKDTAGVTVDDIAKRLMDYGFHAPTMSWPVAGTFMIEPTESESKAELDRLCDALIAIKAEADDIAAGKQDAEDNALKHAPHTALRVTADDWPHAYSRQQAAYPAPWLKDHKFWPPVGRIDNPFGDRNLVCTCPPMEDFAEESGK